MAQRPKNAAFGWLFVVAGLVPIGMAALAVWNWNRARSWSTTDASVISAEVVTTAGTGARGRSTSTTLNVVYQYDWEGETVTGSQVSPFDAIECFASHKKKLAARLREAKSSRSTVLCYVNAGDPPKAYIDLEFRWLSTLIMIAIGVLFSGVGTLLVRRQ